MIVEEKTHVAAMCNESGSGPLDGLEPSTYKSRIVYHHIVDPTYFLLAVARTISFYAH